MTPCALTEQLIQAIDNGICNHNIDYITLSGGEPTLHPSFHEIVSYCVSKGVRIGILSNGDIFFQKENVQRLFADIDPRYLNVITAIHSDCQDLHDRVTGVTGSFKHTVWGLKNVMEMKIPVTVKQVISRWNYNRLPDFIDFVYREYGNFVSLTLCGMDFCGMHPEQIHDVAIGYTKIGVYLEKALDLVMSLRSQFGAFPQVTVTDLPLCCVDPFYWGFFTKVSRGELSQYSAPMNERGQIESSSQIINDCDVYFSACSNCCVASYCPGVWRTAYEYFGEEEACCIYPAEENATSFAKD